jgi:hypothetical protein
LARGGQKWLEWNPRPRCALKRTVHKPDIRKYKELIIRFSGHMDV